jgi:chromosomal replication initiation ATPase DnaA
MYYHEMGGREGVMGPLEAQIRARHLAAKERLWPAKQGADAPARSPEDVVAALSALRHEFMHLHILLQAKGILEQADIASPFRLTCAVIRAEVARFYRIPLAEIDAKRRLEATIRPRQVAMYLCKTLTSRSLPHIGILFGRDHATILHAVRKIERLRKDDIQLAAELGELERRIVALAG